MKIIFKKNSVILSLGMHSSISIKVAQEMMRSAFFGIIETLLQQRLFKTNWLDIEIRTPISRLIFIKQVKYLSHSHISVENSDDNPNILFMEPTKFFRKMFQKQKLVLRVLFGKSEYVIIPCLKD